MAGGTLYAYRIINESAEQKAYLIVNIAEKSSAIWKNIDNTALLNRDILWQKCPGD